MCPEPDRSEADTEGQADLVTGDPSLTGVDLRRTIHSVLASLGHPAPAGAGSPLFKAPIESLQLTQFATALSLAVGRHVPLRNVFGATTADELASALARLPATPPTRLTPLSEGRRRDRVSLAFAQERLAFLQQLAGDHAVYQVLQALRLSGPLDVDRFRSSLARVAARLQPLRVRYVPGDEGLVEVEDPDNAGEIFVANASEGEDPNADISRFTHAALDTHHGPCWRVLILRRSDRTFEAVFQFHQLVLDQWGLELFMQALFDEYGRDAAMPAPEPPSFADYAQWHRHWFREHRFERDRHYWLKRLEGAERVTIDPDYSRPAVATFAGRRVAFRLDGDVWLEIEALAARQRATLAMVCFSALAVLIHAQTGRSDLVVGLAVANRNHADAERCAGPLLNTLAVRVNVDGAQRFETLVNAVRERFIDALDHQDMPFDILVEQLRTPRTADGVPLFGVLYNSASIPRHPLGTSDLDVQRVECAAPVTALSDVTVTVDRAGCSIALDYAAELYKPSTIELLAARFEKLLTAVARNPGAQLDALPHRSDREIALLERSERGTPASSPRCLLAEQIVRQAGQEHPDEVAVQVGTTSISYRELDARASRLAAALVARLPPGARIGLSMRRTVDLPVALIGTLRAGITFVPLDTGFPPARLEYMVDDANVALIISDEPVRPKWLAAHRAFATLDELLADASLAVPPPPDPSNPAYVLYTSGSTGRPKGVVVPQRALAAFLEAMQVNPGMSRGDRALAITTLSFDIALLELLLPLSVGARLVIASREEAMDGRLLAALIDEHEINFLQGTPSTWYQLLASGWNGRRGLTALVGGETFPPDLARALLPRVGALWNMYGPTETTIWSTCARVAEPSANVSIGQPIQGTRVVVADHAGRAAGIGVAGEIIIGGEGLALGYLGLERMTRERFTRMPEIDPEAIFYRTGDRGRWLATGELEHLGRIDSQIKIRGYRIEPGEIEHHALTVPGIERAVVTLLAPAPESARLALFVTGRDLGEEAGEQVQATLRAKLPEYMVPHIVRVIPKLPLLPNGKVDHGALRSAAAVPLTHAALDAPLSAIEQGMHAIWCDMLGLPSIGRHQNFFELGGHSLMIMRLVTRVQEDLRRHCSVAHVFRYPTIAGLCAKLETSAPISSTYVARLRREGAQPALFCICGVLIYRKLARRLGTPCPVTAIYVGVAEDANADNELEVRALASRYLEALRAEQPAGPYRLAGFSFGGVLAFEMARRLKEQGEEVELLCLIDSDVPGTSLLTRVGRSIRRVSKSLAKAERPKVDDDSVQYIEAIRKHVPQRYGGDALLVRALHAPHYEPGYGWEDIVGSLRTLGVASGHLEVMAEPSVQQVADAIDSVLAESALPAEKTVERDRA